MKVLNKELYSEWVPARGTLLHVFVSSVVLVTVWGFVFYWNVEPPGRPLSMLVCASLLYGCGSSLFYSALIVMLRHVFSSVLGRPGLEPSNKKAWRVFLLLWVAQLVFIWILFFIGAWSSSLGLIAGFFVFLL